MFHPQSEKNKFGYYSVGEFRTYKKFEAIQLSLQTKQKVVWHFNDEIYDSLDWKQEPRESICDLYKELSQRIRDKYDYVVLMFSGGSDSTAMLRSFIDNQIWPDEILSIHEYKGAGHKDWYLTGEVLNAAVPWIEKNLPPGCPTRYRLVDTSEWQYNKVKNLTLDSIDQSLYEFNNVHNLGNLARLAVRENIEDYRRIIDSGKRLCLVWGEGKPFIHIDPTLKKHIWTFSENDYDMIVGPRYQDNDVPGYFDEMFYHTTLVPELMIKQAHLCLRFLKNNPHLLIDVNTISKYIKSTYYKNIHSPRVFDMLHSDAGPVFTNISGSARCMSLDQTNSILYPGSTKIEYVQGKISRSVMHPRDQWLEKAAPEQSKKWYAHYLNTVGQFDDHWKHYYGSLRHGIRKLTKDYWLE